METGRKEFMSYEYKTVTADVDRASFLLDGYENFGWELDDNIYQNAGEAARAGKQKKVTLRLKIIGILGTAFMAGSTFAVTAQPPMILLCIVLAIPGFLGWILPWFVYKKLLARQTEKITPLIEEKYDEIDAICEKGNKLRY